MRRIFVAGFELQPVARPEVHLNPVGFLVRMHSVPHIACGVIHRQFLRDRLPELLQKTLGCAAITILRNQNALFLAHEFFWCDRHTRLPYTLKCSL